MSKYRLEYPGLLAGHGACGVCEIEHGCSGVACVKSVRMEIFLNLWDELDDLAGACRHIATSTVIELASVARPAATLIVTLVAAGFGWLLELASKA